MTPCNLASNFKTIMFTCMMFWVLLFWMTWTLYSIPTRWPLIWNTDSLYMATDLWPLDSDASRLPLQCICKTIPFLNHLGDPINLSPISLKSNQFENLAQKRPLTFSYFDLYLKNEKLYEFCVTEFFAPYDPRKNLICITTLPKNADYFSAM